jgi:hypothetical protein
MLSGNVSGLNGEPNVENMLLAADEGQAGMWWCFWKHSAPPSRLLTAWLQEGAGPGQPLQGRSFWCMGTAATAATAASRGVAILSECPLTQS